MSEYARKLEQWQVPPMDQKCPSCGKSFVESYPGTIDDTISKAYVQHMRETQTCPNCGYNYIFQKRLTRLTEDIKCPKCGEILWAFDPNKVAYKEIAYELLKMAKNCPKCGFDISTYDFDDYQDETICQVCGGEMVQDPNTGKRVCSVCGREFMRKEKTNQETDKKCPNCGATVTWDPALGKIHCDYCGYERDLPKPDAEQEVCEIDFNTAVNTDSFEWGTEKKTVECKNCGAESIYDALETAAVCPFCGSTQVMPAATKNTIAPGGVCTFSVTKESAGERFTNWLKKKLFVPSKAKKNARPEAFKGVYLPYWTFDAQTTSNFTGRAGYDRRVKKKDGNYETVTDWKFVAGIYQEFFDDKTVMASKRQNNSILKQCEPFQLSKLIPYTPQALSGFAAERYSIGLKDGWSIAEKEIKNDLKSSIDRYIKNHWRCDRVSSVRFSTLFSKMTYKYILVPVWVSYFRYNDKIYQFVVNGQTGKVGGKAPISVWRVLLAIAIGIGAIVGLIALLG